MSWFSSDKASPRHTAGTAALLALLLLAGLVGCGGGGNDETPPEPPPPPPAPFLLTRTLPDGTVGFNYSATLSAVSGTPPYTWAVTAGNLPAGLALDSDTGEIFGIPTTTATFAFTIEVSDTQAQTASRDFTVTIGNPIPLVTRVSVPCAACPDSEANSESGTPAVSDDGRFIAFTSFADNLILNDTNSVTDIFVRDLTCGETWRVSVDSSGGEGNSNSFAPSVSALTGGTLFFAYASDANNLVPNDTNDARDVFVTAVAVSGCTLTPLSTVRASVASDGTEGNSGSNLPVISDDGLSVAYASTSDNLVGGDTNGAADIFVTQLQFVGGVLSVVETRRVSKFKVSLPLVPETTADIFSSTTIGNSTLSFTPDEHVGRLATIVSGTGQGQLRTITTNDATTLTVSPPWDTTPDDTSVFRVETRNDQTADVFSNTTIGNSTLTMTDDEFINFLVEIVGGTGQGQSRAITTNDATTLTVDPPWTTDPDGTSIFRVLLPNGTPSQRAAINADGSLVAFQTNTGFEVLDDNGLSDVFLHDVNSGLSTRVSVSNTSETATGTSNLSDMDGNGTVVLFQSAAANLVASDSGPTPDLFVRDVTIPETRRVSLADDGSEADGSNEIVAGISGGGNVVAFTSFARNLVADDRNEVRDVFLRQGGTTRRLSVGLGGINPDNESFDVAISADGSTVAFASAATNLVLNDTNDARDIFVQTTGVLDPKMIVLARLPTARQGSSFTASLQVVGGRKPHFWTVSEGRLPPGLFLDAQTGRISGIPQQPGRYAFTVTVMDAGRPPRHGSRRVTLVVEP